MYNYMLRLRFDGAPFHGWQLQPGLETVQGCLERALMLIFSQRCALHGCSRTDAGVHANEFYCNFHAERSVPEDTLVRALNANIPSAAAVLDCRLADGDFHARFSCTGKQYVYKIHNSPVRDPFTLGRAYHYKYRLDEKLLDSAARQFIGAHDFRAFMSSGSAVSSTVRTVTQAQVSRRGDEVSFTVSADGFLYNMVRIMVGTLINIGEGKLCKDAIADIIASRDRENAGVTAPAHGLYLNRVYYGGDLYE